MKFEEVIKNVDLIDNYKKYRYFKDFLYDATYTRYEHKYPGLRSGRATTNRSILHHCYPIFKKEEEDTYTLYLFFPKEKRFHKWLIDCPNSNHKKDIIDLLKESTKKDFTIEVAFFEEEKRFIHQDAREYIDSKNLLQEIEEAEKILEEQKKKEEYHKMGDKYTNKKSE